MSAPAVDGLVILLPVCPLSSRHFQDLQLAFKATWVLQSQLHRPSLPYEYGIAFGSRCTHLSGALALPFMCSENALETHGFTSPRPLVATCGLHLDARLAADPGAYAAIIAAPVLQSNFFTTSPFLDFTDSREVNHQTLMYMPPDSIKSDLTLSFSRAHLRTIAIRPTAHGHRMTTNVAQASCSSAGVKNFIRLAEISSDVFS